MAIRRRTGRSSPPLCRTIEKIRTGKAPTALLAELKALDNYDDFATECESHGVFTNVRTLEVDLFDESDEYREAIMETLREGPFGAERKGWIDEWGADPKRVDICRYLALIDQIGKGRFAQRLSARIGDLAPPGYIAGATRVRVSRRDHVALERGDNRSQ